MMYFFQLSFLLLLFACQSPTLPEQADSQPVYESAPSATVDCSKCSYKWLKDSDIASENRLAQRFPAPKGYSYQLNNDFAQWLRCLPLKPGKPKVMLYNGQAKGYQGAQEAVLELDVQNADLQQCADAIMRLKAEYHFSRGEYAKIHFNFTSGHKVSFDDWGQGRKPVIKGNSVNFSPKTSSKDYSYANFRKYMTSIFNYAGTASLEKELQMVDIAEIQSGDVFIQGGFPGHAVIVLDVVQNAQGKRLFCLAQSYMPAQDMHLLRNPNKPDISPWYEIPTNGVLETPEWTFDSSKLRRWKE
jgi:hypothetical protein